MANEPLRIAGTQGFYGDSPLGALAVAQAHAADVLVHDALAELTLSILQKDRQKDPNMGYARDIELHARTLFPLALSKGMRVVSNSGGLNPHSAAQVVAGLLAKSGIKSVKIAAITGDNLLDELGALQQAGHDLAHLDSGETFAAAPRIPTHAAVYIGAQSIKDALDQGAQIILAGRVADPALTLGTLAHHYGWQIEPQADAPLSQVQLNLLAQGITIGHLLECGGQASGGNSYAEWQWPSPYKFSNLGYPIAHVWADGSAELTRLEGSGGKVSRDTLREQLVYEIHDPSCYLTPDVTVDLTQVRLQELGPDRVRLSGAQGRTRPDRLKLTIGLQEGYLTEQFFFFSWPHAWDKARAFVEAAEQIWSRLPIQLDRTLVSYIGVDGIHPGAAPRPPDDELNQRAEIGIRLALQHANPNHGKMAIQALTSLALNGPPGLISLPGWGNTARQQLGLWPTLIPRELVKPEVTMYES